MSRKKKPAGHTMTQVYYLSIYIILPTCVYIIEPAGPPAAPVYFFFFFELNIFFCNIYQDFFVYPLHHIDKNVQEAVKTSESVSTVWRYIRTQNILVR